MQYVWEIAGGLGKKKKLLMGIFVAKKLVFS